MTLSPFSGLLDLRRHTSRIRDGLGGVRRLRPGRPGTALHWLVCLPRIVVVAVDLGVDPDELGVWLKTGGGAPAVPLARAGLAFDRSDVRLVFYRIPDEPAEARVIATLHGRTHRSGPFRFVPGSAVIVIEGVLDYRLVGWAAPLVETASFDLEFLVDGEPQERGAPDFLRRDLLRVTEQGGWNGFSFALPPQALDGRPHRFAIRCGDSAVEHAPWAAAPKYHIDNLDPDRLTGWFFDPGLINAAATVRLVADGRDVSVQETHPRPDLRELFRRSSGAFAFVDTKLRPGLELRVGRRTGGLALGRIVGDTFRERLRGHRAEARRALLAQRDAAASLDIREGIRTGPIEEARTDTQIRLRWQAAQGDVSGDQKARAATSYEAAVSPPLARVCAIVPVYRGIEELRACIASLLPQLAADRVRLLVVNDASPDPEITAWLTSSEWQRPGVTILTNDVNRGFIGTVNRGFAELASGEDAIIVNSDTVLPAGAIAKLARHCHGRPGVASVTPMSNNATILSFPSTRDRNGPLLGLGAEALDRVFEQEGRDPIELPTAIGFCMYVNRTALDEVGPFSPEWGRGYCEEVDWSLIARDLGWIHLAATDTFVEHEGSVSFGSAERTKILADNHARLELKYPEYLGEVMAIVAADPFEDVRRRVLAACLADRFAQLTLHVMHGLGGGTKRYVDDLAALPRAGDHELGVVTLFTDESGSPRLRLSLASSEARIELAPANFQEMLGALEQAGISVRLHINSRLNYSTAFLDEIARSGRPYVVTLHDYQWYCPKVHLIDERVFYCGEPEPEICQLCVRHRRTHDFGDQNAVIEANIADWLAFNRRFLANAETLFAPSRDTAARYQARLGLMNIAVRPHVENAQVENVATEQPQETAGGASTPRSGGLRIAILGAIGDHKGFDLVVRMAELAELQRRPLFVQVIGYTPDGGRLTRLSNAAVSGPYEPDEVTGLLEAFDPDFVFLPSVWPETYSYVLSEAWAAGFAVVAFDFGAQAERIRDRGGGVLIPPTRDAGELLDALFAARSRLPERVPTASPTQGSLEDYYLAAKAP